MHPTRSFAVFAAAAALASCTASQPGAQKLAPVAALPSPSLPPWISTVSPTKSAQGLAQIRVIFAKPVAPVEALASAGAADVLSRLSIEPKLAGRFTLLTPRMIGFVAEQALPVGTRVRVTLGAGLHDLAGDALSNDLAWTFDTTPLALSDLPSASGSADDEATPPPVGLTPAIDVTSNAAVDPSSLGSLARLDAPDGSVAMTATLKVQPTPYPGSDSAALFDPSLNDWVYTLRPVSPLRRGTAYKLRIAPGVQPAYGNVPSTDTYEGSIRTYGDLTILPTPRPSPGSGSRFALGDPVVSFSNPLDPKSVSASAVTISPAPAAVKDLLSVPDGSNQIAIDPYALDPNATYSVTVAGSVRDVFGQSLGRDERLTVTTSDFAPGAWAPSGVSIIPAGAPVALNFYATNLPGNAYRAAYASAPPVKMLGSPDALSVLPAPAAWPSRTLAGAKRNAQSVVSVPLAAQLRSPYGALAYGFLTALDSPGSTPSLTGVAQLTNLGVFAQWFPAHGMVLVQQLSDGAPVAGAAVTVYRVDEENKLPPVQCASGTTGAAGEVDFNGVDVERCSANAQAGQAPNLGFTVTRGADVATVTTWNWSGVSRFDVSPGWTSGAPLSRGTVFPDRDMYQPGERGRLTGIAYYVKGAAVVADANATYRVKLVDPNNSETTLGSVKTDAYGVFSLPVSFSNRQPLGYYTIDAKGANGNDLSGSFRVAEFKPPNFKLALTLAAPSAVAGSSVNAGVSASYLFGAPLQGGTAHATVTRDLATVQPKGWDDFSFGPQWFWPEQTPEFTTDVLQKDLPLDDKGGASLVVGVPADLPFPMTYRVDVETTDVSNLSVADSQSFLALPGSATIGLASDTVGKAGSPMPVRVIVTDADGAPVAGRSVHLELQKMTFTSASQEVEGGDNADQSVKYDTVASADVASAERPVTAQLTPPDAAPYRIRANFAGASGAATASDLQVFAFGAGESDWGLSDPNAVAVELDKKQYAVGDTASALVASPYDRADVYFSVVRGDTLYRTTLRDVRGAAHVTFKVTPQMLPNAAVEAVVVHRGSIGKPPKEDTLSRTGMAAFTVDVGQRYLQLTIAPQDAKVTPGSKQHVSFALRTKSGAAARGEIVAMVVNDAILQLSGYRLPDLVQTVFASQPIATIFADNRENVTLTTQTAPLEKGFGYGGGYLAGAASTRVRANFQPLAYYGVLETDAAGKASATFAMPDDLTTWRVMAVGLGADTAHFGVGDATFLSNLPLATNPLLPQFARPGDRFDLGVSVANQTGAAGALNLVLALEGALRFAQGDPHRLQTDERAVAGMQAFRFPVTVGTPAPTLVSARSSLGTHGDAFRVPFAASDLATTESVIESGATRGETSIPIALHAGGSLQITLANSVVPQFAVASERVMAGDGVPLTDDAASRLTIASALARLKDPYRLSLAFDPVAARDANLQRLLSYQRGDGGFAAFAGASESDPFATAAALDALTFARAHGVRVDAGALANAAAFTEQSLANPGRFKWCGKDALCKAQLRFEALWALGGTGVPRTDFLASIVAQSDRFDSATQIRLARYLLRVPGWHDQGAAMAGRLEQTVYVTGRYAVANVAERWAWLGSEVQAQSQMLQLLLERGADPQLVDGAVRALFAQRCRCGWPTADDTSAALEALSAYAATEHLAPAAAQASVGGVTVASARFGQTASLQTFTLAANSLHGDAVVIRSLSRSGAQPSLHYTVLYTYPVAPDAPGALTAFRVVRTLQNEAANGGAPIVTMDLGAVAPVAVQPSAVFDVGLRVIVDHPVDRLIVDDPLPAGFEAVDGSFRTSSKAALPQADSWDIDAKQIYRDRVVAYAQHLGPGVYDVHYLVRSVTPGSFAWPGARAYLQDAPEQFGRSAATTLQIRE